MPAEAKLFINDRAIQVSSQHPVFVTPGLQAGKTYYYDLRAEILRDGKPVSDTKRVVWPMFAIIVGGTIVAWGVNTIMREQRRAATAPELDGDLDIDEQEGPEDPST